MQALELARAVGDELPELNAALRRTHSLEAVARQARDPAAALAYLRAADRVIQVDDFADPVVGGMAARREVAGSAPQRAPA
jgi:acyl-CoA dehydrogenase